MVRIFWKIPKIPHLLTIFSQCVFLKLTKDPKDATFVYDWHKIGETKGNTLKVKCSVANHEAAFNHESSAAIVRYPKREVKYFKVFLFEIAHGAT